MAEVSTSAGEVLIVEDDVLVRTIVAEAIEDAGFGVVAAATGDEALQHLQSGLKPAAVVTDIEMPGAVDGIKLAHWLWEQHRDIGVLVMSGRHALGSDQLPQGTGFLAKPFALDKLVTVVETVIVKRCFEEHPG